MCVCVCVCEKERERERENILSIIRYHYIILPLNFISIL